MVDFEWQGEPVAEVVVEESERRLNGVRRVLVVGAMIVPTVIGFGMESDNSQAIESETVAEVTVGETAHLTELNADQVVAVNSNADVQKESPMLGSDWPLLLVSHELSCAPAKTSIPNVYSFKDVVEGSKTNFALTPERLEQVSSALKEAGEHDVKAVRSVVTEVFSELGVRVSFDDPALVKDDDHSQPGTKIVTVFSKSELITYAESMAAYIRGVSAMSREFVQTAGQIDFVSSRFMAAKGRPDFEASGYAYSQGNIIRLAALVDPSVDLGLQIAYKKDVIRHEYSHLAEFNSCPTGDRELEATFAASNRGLQLAAANALVRNGTQMQGPPNPSALSLTVLQKMGFERDYSMSGRGEMLADKAAALIDGRFGSPYYNYAQTSKLAEAVEDTTIERLQMAQPNTNVVGWLAYLNYTQDGRGAEPDTATLEKLMPLKLSLLDRTIGQFGFSIESEEWAFEPAIQVDDEAENSTSFIYGVRTTNLDRPQVAFVSFRAQAGQEGALTNAAKRYLMKLRAHEPRFVGASLRVTPAGDEITVSLVQHGAENAKGGSPNGG